MTTYFLKDEKETLKYSLQLLQYKKQNLNPKQVHIFNKRIYTVKYNMIETFDENLLLSDLRLKAKATFNLYIMPHIENALIAQELLIYLGTFQFSDI